jgi:hypothetical protein
MNMQGYSGERLGDSYIADYFCDIAKLLPDQGVDLLARLQPQYRSDHERSPIFAFQIKNRKRFEIKPRSFRNWNLYQPFILIWTRITGGQPDEVAFCVLHDWMVENVDWPDRLIQKTFTIPRICFTPIKRFDPRFLDAAQQEERRILGVEGSPFRTIKTLSIPMNEMDLYRNLVLAPSIEVPSSVLQEIRALPNLSDDNAAWLFLRDSWLNPHDLQPCPPELSSFSAWKNSIAESYPADQLLQGRQELRRFFQALSLSCRSEKFPFPSFTFQSLHWWRTFSLIFPETLPMLNNIICFPSKWDTDAIKSSFVLLSMIATSDDLMASNKAMDLFRSVENMYGVHEVSDFNKYQIVRQYAYNRSEAEGGRFARDCRDLIHRCRPRDSSHSDWELLLHRQYYRSNNSALASSLKRKFAMPKKRDDNAWIVNNLIWERLPPDLT